MLRVSSSKLFEKYRNTSILGDICDCRRPIKISWSRDEIQTVSRVSKLSEDLQVAQIAITTNLVSRYNIDDDGYMETVINEPIIIPADVCNVEPAKFHTESRLGHSSMDFSV